MKCLLLSWYRQTTYHIKQQYTKARDEFGKTYSYRFAGKKLPVYIIISLTHIAFVFVITDLWRIITQNLSYLIFLNLLLLIHRAHQLIEFIVIRQTYFTGGYLIATVASCLLLSQWIIQGSRQRTTYQRLYQNCYYNWDLSTKN